MSSNVENLKTILYIKNEGGLGNQLFQNCFVYSIAKNNNSKFVILSTNKLGRENENYTNTIFKDFPYLSSLQNINLPTYWEKGDNFTKFDNISLPTGDVLFRGYFQNEKYFKKYKNELIHLLTNNSLYSGVISTPSYFIHIRRGDYVNNSHHYVELNNYYINAVKYITDKDPVALFYIISDDIEWCKTYEPLANIDKIFYENTNELETLYFMSKCIKGGICGNSTFAWWGSYLNQNSNKIVIFPNKWINTSAIIDIYYEDSIVLDV